jgi:hypothetical protein
VLDQYAVTAFQQNDGEEIRPSWNSIAAVRDRSATVKPSIIWLSMRLITGVSIKPGSIPGETETAVPERLNRLVKGIRSFAKSEPGHGISTEDMPKSAPRATRHAPRATRHAPRATRHAP